MTNSEPLHIFIGWDSKEPLAFAVLVSSILRRATSPISITPITRASVRRIYTRARGTTESTEFSLTRFLVPYLSNYVGWSVFMDCDMLCQVDLTELLLEISLQRTKSVLVCQHDYTPKSTVKFLNQVQTVYPRKNWSSFMVFNNARCKALTPEYVNTATGLELHRFAWVADEQIGSLPLAWNYLVGEYPPDPEAKILHYTLGGPWFGQITDHSQEWLEEWQAMERCGAVDTGTVGAYAALQGVPRHV